MVLDGRDVEDECDVGTLVPRGVLDGIDDVAEGDTASVEDFLDAKKF